MNFGLLKKSSRNYFCLDLCFKKYAVRLIKNQLTQYKIKKIVSLK